MFLFRTLSVPGTGLKTQISGLVLVSFVAQSCSAISSLSQRDEEPFALPRASNETTSADVNVQKVSVEPEGRRASLKRATKHVLNGMASWYGPGFHGKKKASGEIYDQNKLTAAHKTVPLGSKARVTNLENGNSVEVEINDRGPFVEGRIIDLSRAAAGALGIVGSGTAPVQVELIREPTGSSVGETTSNK
jgi:rare lipoprotein A (peptidoglycan hydrolase)